MERNGNDQAQQRPPRAEARYATIPGLRRLSAAAFGSAAFLDQLSGCKYHLPLGRKVKATYFV
jgi:hypothetical protein